MIPTSKSLDEWLELSNELLPKYGINTAPRVAGFFAQGGHESLDFNILKENLNYSAEGLRKTFGPRYFPTLASAQAVARNPEAIANIVYNDANRKNKLGNTRPGDGWLFFGRGIFQLTGRFNYTKFGTSIGKTAEETAVYCETKRGAFESACWYWTVNNLNAFADTHNIVGMSARVNGGDNGLADRKIRWARCLKAVDGLTFNSSSTPIVEDVAIVPSNYRALAAGSKGEDVKEVQKFLKLSADGVFGRNTRNAVMSWQRSNKFSATGTLTVEQQKLMLED